jgi:hypothetical protein
MARRLLCLVVLALLVTVGVAHAASSQAPDITDTHYTSVLEKVQPQVAGVTWRVIDLNDEIEVRNRSKKRVIIYGYSSYGDSSATHPVAYDGGQYARVLPGGAVEVNENSPAYYLNQSFFADYANVPATASTSAQPDWVTLARTGEFIWHDHRIHYVSPVVPQFIRKHGLDKRQLVFSWYVPIQVGTQRGYLYGKLYWNAEKAFAFPLAAIVVFVVIVIAGVAFVAIVRRRRGHSSPREAW